MNREHKDLYERIRKFRFDPDGATATFAGRLASENGWSAKFTARVIEEYRKFGHKVVSDDVEDAALVLGRRVTRSGIFAAGRAHLRAVVGRRR